MRILLGWLRDYLDLPEPAAQVAHALTMGGLKVDSIVEEQGETVMEMDFTPNRPDAMNHLGVAQELAALFGRRAGRPEIRIEENARPSTAAARIDIDDADLCARYTARVAWDVIVKPAPDWMRRRLELCGIRSINNVADVTNYVLLEGGHPTHAFDLDTLSEARIIVRRPRPGERLKTLDGVERILDRDHLVIADGRRPVALAGVMGGGETEITGRTRHVLIESAWFEPASIRRTARHFGLHTEASHRFERGADIEATTWSTDRIASLLAQLASATILAGRIDAYPSVRRRGEILLRESALLRHLGIAIPATEVERILLALGFRAGRCEQGWMVIPPTARLDVEREIDLVEEVARLYGYDRFPSRLPEWAGRAEPSRTGRQQARLRERARALGYDEAVTHSFLSSAEAAQFGAWKPVSIRNPISEQQDVMRNSSVPGLLRAVEWNVNRGLSEVRLFELGRLYKTEGEAYSEPDVLALAALGGDFYQMKADATKLLEPFAGEKLSFEPENGVRYYRRGRCARALADGASVGRFGEIHPQLAAERKLRQPLFLGEFWLDALYRYPLREPRFRPLPRVPAVDRDLSLLLPEGTQFGQIVEALGRREHLVRLDPVEIFRGGQVPAGKYSLLLRAVWQRDDASLTDEQVNGYARQIVETLKKHFGAEQRG